MLILSIRFILSKTTSANPHVAPVLIGQKALDGASIERANASRAETVKLRRRAAGQLIGDGPPDARRDSEAVPGAARRDRQPREPWHRPDERDTVEALRFESAPLAGDRERADDRHQADA